MPFSNDHRALIETLAVTWPPSLRPDTSNDGPVFADNHPLAGELSAVENQSTFSLPYFIADQPIAWFTVAPTAEDLQGAILHLRAWLIPSFAWEDSRGWLVTPSEAQGEIGQRLMRISPAGYCRWRSPREQLDVVLEKLRLSRAVDSARPLHEFTQQTSLMEARERFIVALLAGNRAIAEAAIDVIDSRQLDSADNTLFMRYRCWSHFRDWQSLLSSPHLDHFIQLQSPRRVRLGVLEAFHSTFIAPTENEGDLDAALEQYRERVHGRVGDMVAGCEVEDGEVAQRLMAYRLVQRCLDGTVPDVIPQFRDSVALAIVSRLPPPQNDQDVDPVALWEDARLRGEWEKLQSIGSALLDDHPEYVPVLQHSLEHAPNRGLSERLRALHAAAEPNVPQSWMDWVQRLVRATPAQTLQFVENRRQFVPDSFATQEAGHLHDALEELYVEGRLQSDPVLRQELLVGLPELLFDFVRDPQFPRARFAAIYLQLFRLWSALKRGSVAVSDATFLLSLAEGVLRHSGDAEAEVAGELQQWWQARSVKALLPFVLDAVELLDEIGADSQRENLWLSAAEFIRRNEGVLVSSERTLWRTIGAKVGFDQHVLDEYIPLPAAAEIVDPLGGAGLRRIAIVSLRERQAQEAAEILRSRCGAEVTVVTSTVADSSTDAACAADVILFVWGATSHAVFRAFDECDRTRLAYVSGTGAASIVRALERWLESRKNA